MISRPTITSWQKHLCTWNFCQNWTLPSKYLVYETLISDIGVRYNSDKAKMEHQNLEYNRVHKKLTEKQVAQVKTRYRTTFQRWDAINEEVLCFEEEHNIQERWMPGSDEYENGLVSLREQRYKVALDHLEHLVVQRLFEMTKLNISSVGTS